MPRHKVVELPLIPGSITDDTDLAAALHAIDMDKTRFRGKRAETIKGWTAFNASGLTAGTARGIHSYADLNGTPAVVAASESAINAWKGGSRFDITPKWVDVWLDETSVLVNAGVATCTWKVYTPATNSFATAAHNLKVGDSVTFSGVNDTTGKAALNGTFTIASVPSTTTFTFSLSGTSPAPTVAYVATVAFRNGLANGTGDTPSTRARVWSIDNFGAYMVACGSDGTPIFTWSGNTSAAEHVTNGDFAAGGSWVTGTGWAITGGVARHSGASVGTLSQLVTNMALPLEHGKTYEMSFQVVTYTAQLTAFQVQIDAIDIFAQGFDAAPATPADAQRTYTFRFICPPDPVSLKFIANGAAGTNIEIDNVSIKELTIAEAISQAPQINYALFTDQNRMLVALGTVEADGDFNPLMVRWCAQDDFRDWVPDTDTLAGEYPLGKGSYLVCGKPCGQVNLILTDDPAYTMTFNGTGFSFRMIGEGCGAVGNRALAVNNNRAMWASLSGFYGFDGAQVLMIECPHKDKYVGKLRANQANKTFAWLNSEYGEVWFHYAHTSDSDEVTRYLIFNYLEEGNPWSFGTFDRTCWMRSSVYPNPIAIDASDNIWNHETGTTMSGSITLPFVETGYVTGEAGDQWLGCRRYYPDIESQTGNITWTITGKRAPQGSSLTQAISKTLVPDQRKADFLISSRQFKFKWASAASPTSWRLGVVGLEMRAQKERR